jgi:SAM-dependent methyltransferase
MISKNNENNLYVCPLCKSNLKNHKSYYLCGNCHNKFAIDNGIPDFFKPIKTENKNIILQSINKIDILAKIYETPLWYPIVYHIYGGLGIPSVNDTTKIITAMLDINKGLGLDIACGTGLYTRSIAQKMNCVFGIDISKGMLNKAKKIANKESIRNIKLARANAENLPFPNNIFNAACCSGALHLFPNTIKTLKEISRVLKVGSPLAVMTFVRERFLKHRFIYEHLKEKHGATIFNINSLEKWLSIAGFKNFKPKIFGSMILFRVQKK